MREALEAARPLRGRQRGPFLGNAEIRDCALGRHRLLRAVEWLHAARSRSYGHPLHARRTGGEDVELETLQGESLARVRDPAQRLNQQPTHRLGAPAPGPAPAAPAARAPAAAAP